MLPILQLIELHDSDLGQVQVSGRNLTIVLDPAYVHRSEGRAGIDPGTGWWQVAEFAFANAVPRTGINAAGELEVKHKTLADGWIHAPRWHCDNGIPLPLDTEGPVWFFARTKNNEDLIVEGEHLSVTLTGEATYCEETEGIWLGGSWPT